MRILSGQLVTRCRHELRVELTAICANKQRAFKAQGPFYEHIFDRPPHLKLHMNAAARTLWRPDPTSLLRRQPTAPCVSTELGDHLAKAFLELEAARQCEPSVFPLKIEPSIGRTDTASSLLSAFGRTKIAVRNLLAQAAQHGGFPRGPTPSLHYSGFCCSTQVKV
jgi:hypothetical protein